MSYQRERDQTRVRVIFRMHAGEVIALMPDLPADYRGNVQGYVHCGQHTAVHFQYVIAHSRPATPEEYAPLLRELTSVPYEYQFDIRRRFVRRGTK